MTESPLILNILIAFGAFQAIFLATVFLLQPKKTLPKKFFAFFLIIEGITLIERLLFETNLIENTPHLLGISTPLNFIKPPILLFMAMAITRPEFKFRKIHVLHLLFFLLILIMNIPLYMMTGADKITFTRETMMALPDYTNFNFYFSLTFFANIGAYLLVAIRALRKYCEHVKNNQLASWYLRILKLYTAALVLGLIYFAILPSGLIEIPLFNTISMLSMTFLIQSIAYRFFIKSDLLNTRSSTVGDNIQRLLSDEKRIREKLEVEKAHLSDSLDLENFAKSLDLPKKYVSDLINQKFGKSFKALINEYRVEEAKAMMGKEKDLKVQLIDIGLESGFNNKVSFYRVFKQSTGKSPSQYLDDLRSDHSAK
ncbi:MAG: AraC family transcriptional regulator [Roseivirga sp.]|nr:AraC family transcriptional regulator [Roseivirga sp.]